MPTPLARSLFGRLFDNAAMYPPAQAPMEAALGLYDATERAPWGFARGRFLCPGAGLGGLATELRLLGLDRKALRDQAPGVHVEMFEVRPTDQAPESIGQAVHEAAEAAHEAGAEQLFVEVAVAGEDTATIHERIAAVAEAGARHPLRVGTKVRCGGLEPGMVPSAAQLGTFLWATRDRHLPFKATAGLHHAFAALGEADGETRHHGFVSLLVASIAASHADLDSDQTARLLDSRADDLQLHDDTLVVHHPSHDVLTIPVQDVTSARYGGFIAFGTCSFTEPAAEAAALIGNDA